MTKPKNLQETSTMYVSSTETSAPENASRKPPTQLYWNPWDVNKDWNISTAVADELLLFIEVETPWELETGSPSLFNHIAVGWFDKPRTSSVTRQVTLKREPATGESDVLVVAPRGLLGAAEEKRGR